MFLGVSYALRVGFGVGDSFILISIYTLALSAVPERRVLYFCCIPNRIFKKLIELF